MTIVTIATTYKHFTAPAENIAADEETNPTSNNQVTNNQNKNSSRGPASTNGNSQQLASSSNAAVKSSTFNQADFNNLPAESTEEGTGGNNNNGGATRGGNNNSAGNSAFNSLVSGDFMTPTSSPDLVSKLPSDKSNLPETGKRTIGPTFSAPIPPKNTNNIIVSNTPSTPPTTATQDNNTCLADTTSGAFSNPIGIKITCTAQSTIKYCFGLGDANNCCDPLASDSLDYSSQIVLGQTQGTFCLSYYGQSSFAGDSAVYQQVYSFNTTLPNLDVTHPQLFYQTTQMYAPNAVNNANFINSFTNVHSTDFGKDHFGIGQINLRSHDPVTEALDCEQIVSDFASLTMPVAQVNLSFLDVSSTNSSQQLEIPLLLNNVDYGNNHITTYMENRTYVDIASVYACHNAVVNLYDFDYFQAEQLAFSADVNSVREFTGAFSPYGFFEEAATPNGNFGVASKDQTGQKLEYGMFGSIY